ncbi:hypothetical protein [Amycolatopsis sp. Hca4]|uniref:hypothetical protein n=1 Tax=Amycolatopsis sp. Hca4 TaxID=2742131 RepID=UPI0015910717|nr:hypothetical protein [Amycolatopsis sp. Hca4]QKV73992.1 hypothetical protein HUT10_09580 [Amycolatopsis sp. Hca4]
MTDEPIQLSNREWSILRAVAAGRGVLVASGEPDLRVDGCWCDRVAVHNLVQAGLIAAEWQVAYGQPTPAVATRRGRALLAEGTGSRLHHAGTS